MKNSGKKGNPAAIFMKHETYDITDGKKPFTTSPPAQSPHHSEKKNNIIGFSEDVRLKRLMLENQRLKNLIEDLSVDKFSQAQRITELNEEISRLKKTLADLVLVSRHE